MDLTYEHGSDIFVLKASYFDDSIDLVAFGSESSVDVLQVSETSCRLVASFQVGCRLTALAWSSRSVSPSSSDEWRIELAAAAADFGLSLLTKSAEDPEEYVFPFGGGLSGHHGKVNDMTFCGGRGDDAMRYLATVSDDKMLMVWDLQPTVAISSLSPSPSGLERSSSPNRAQPTAYVIPFAAPLTAVCAHPSTDKDLLVADARGSLFLTDWRSDPDDPAQELDNDAWRHSALVELVDPRALADPLSIGGSAGWRWDDADIVGASYGSRFCIWDVTKLGGKPSASGISFPEGGHRFRWSPTHPTLFAISPLTPAKGAALHIHNAAYPHAPPAEIALAPRPHVVRDFDWLVGRGIPRIAAALGRKVVVFAIGEP